ncbi:MAG: protein kinase [Oscillospiraceae bacterium]|nr:protein kinase [Oscillospiraceae bacterium]
MSLLPALSDPAYRIEAELGSGGGSVVYKAWHTRLQKSVVLKRIKDESGLIQSGLQRGEADIMKNLKHAYLPQLYDFLEDSGGVYTVMEFIPGHSFAELLREGRLFAQKDVVRWAEQLAAALAYLHGQDPIVLHSDIKPANIMLTPDGNVCLIDFNISLVLDDGYTQALGLSHGYASPEQYGPLELPKTQTPVGSRRPQGDAAPVNKASYAITELNGETFNSSITDLSTGNTTDIQTSSPYRAGAQDYAGSPPYHAGAQDHAGAPYRAGAQDYAGSPDRAASSLQRRERIRMDARSDIYSFGATMYHLLTGTRPEIATGGVKPLRDFGDIPLSEAFIYIIERCMERDPAKRFQSAADLYDAISNIHRLDNRWKRQRVKTTVTIIVLSACLIAFGATTAFGQQLMGSEKLEKYNALVLDIATDNSDSAYNNAIALFPGKLGAYREQAVKLCIPGSYDECVEYVKNAMAKLSAYRYEANELLMIGDIYYTQGNAYFELGDYPNSLLAYEAAIGNNPNNPEMFRDFAIALVRCSYIERAEELLIEISGMGLGDDSINLLKGEIAYAKGDDNLAIQLFESVIRESDSTYIRYRAYLMCANSYRREPELIRSEITLLRNAMVELPDNYGLIIKEWLADALIRAGEYAEATALFEELRRSGIVSYQIWQNIGVLNQQTGDFAAARSVYTDLAESYPDDYRPPMRLAYLILEEQSARSNEAREYGEAARWYALARELYEKRPRGAGDDMEMNALDGLMTELRQNGWLETIND